MRFRFSPQTAAEPAVIHFEFADGGVITALINPGMGGARVIEGDVDFDLSTQVKAEAG